MSDPKTGITKRTSLVKLLSESEHLKIMIPQIQRDYVQGRDDKESIRTPFLQKLKGNLVSGTSLNLDLIYGYIRNDVEFIPLDGQQRLTTLFLLHWYLAIVDGKYQEFKRTFYPEKEARFVYQTRESASEFCAALCEIGSQIAVPKTKDIATIINESSFYKDYWYSDPTIQAMLAMLNAIAEIFSVPSGLYQRLAGSSSLVTFDYLDIQSVQDSDLLYIKMNDRGLPLSSFDELKASIENYLRYLKENKQEIPIYFSKALDGEWTDLVWDSVYAEEDSFSSDTFDAAFSHLFFAQILTSIAALDDSGIDEIIKSALTDLIAENPDPLHRSLSFFEWKRRGVFLTQEESLGWKGSIFTVEDEKQVAPLELESNALILRSLFDGMQSIVLLRNRTIPSGQDEIILTPQNLNFSQLLKQVQYSDGKDSTERKYADRVLLFALEQFEYVAHSLNEVIDIEVLKLWARIIQNLNEASIYNDEKNFIASIKGIKEALSIKDLSCIRGIFSPATLSRLKKPNGFDSVQVDEEIIKCRLMEEQDDWRTALVKAEEILPYFEGQIGFLLHLAGIEIDTLDVMGPFLIPADALAKFEEALSKTQELFDMKKKFAFDNTEYIFERALLSLGKYLLPSGGRNQSFLIMSHRDYSWKRFFKLPNKNEISSWEKRKQIIRRLFDSLELGKVNQSLQRIIDGNQVKDWRKCIIDTPSLLKYFEGTNSQRFLQIDSPHGIVLLQKTRLSASHAEIYSYRFYCQHKNDTESTFGIFGELSDYYAVSGASDPYELPCAYFTGWKRDETHQYGLDIHYQNDLFGILVFNRMRDQDIEDDVRQVLIEQGMQQWNEEDVRYGFIRYLTQEESLVPAIQNLSLNLSILDSSD